MITAGEFRKGVTFELEGKVYVVVDFLHVKPGKGSAFVRTKIKNVVTGQVIEKTFNPTERFEKAHIERKEMSYLYEDGGLYYFMDNNTYEQIPLNKDGSENALIDLKIEENDMENPQIKISFANKLLFSEKLSIIKR